MATGSYDVRGQVIGGRYRLANPIGHGGMGEVWLAEDVHLGEGHMVAVKFMSEEFAESDGGREFQSRFRREALTAASVRNPHVVSVTDYGEWDGRPYLVMEYVPGLTLRKEMKKKGRFSVRETMAVLGDVLDGLAAIHANGLMHRDIKPANIMHDVDGRYRITDFGLAKRASQDLSGTLTRGAGTLEYMPPEVLRYVVGSLQGVAAAKDPWLPQGDLYSLGTMCWELISGAKPFADGQGSETMAGRRMNMNVPPLSSVYAGIPASFSAFIARLTRREPSERPADARMALDEYNRMRSGLTDTDMAWRAGESPSGDAPFPNIRKDGREAGDESITMSSGSGFRQASGPGSPASGVSQPGPASGFPSQPSGAWGASQQSQPMPPYAQQQQAYAQQPAAGSGYSAYGQPSQPTWNGNSAAGWAPPRQTWAPPAQQQTAAPRKKKRPIVLIVIAAVLVCVIVGIASASNHSSSGSGGRTSATRSVVTPTAAATEPAVEPSETTTLAVISGPVALDEEHFPDEAFRTAVSEAFDTDKDGTLSEAELADATVLGCYECQIQSAQGVEYLTRLTSLYLFSNQLSSVDLSANTQLTGLYLGGNQLSSIDVSANTQLTDLSLWGNQLSSVDLSANTQLVGLDLSGNQLSSVDLSANTQLADLDLSSNQLSSVDLSANTQLASLYLGGNQLSLVDVTNCTNHVDVSADDGVTIIGNS